MGVDAHRRTGADRTLPPGREAARLPRSRSHEMAPVAAADKRRAPIAGRSRTTAVHGITTSLQKSPTRSV
jgi:hypothetical protein